MRTLKTALLATAATVALSSATVAADLIIADPIIDNMFTVACGFDGPYAGLFVSGQTHPDGFGIGANLGVNACLDSSLLIGVEGSVAYLLGGAHDWTGQIHGKLGVVADQVAFYGLLGIGTTGAGGAFVPIGVGAEFLVADDFSLKAEYQYQWSLSGAPAGHVGKVGFNWHF